MMIAIVYEGVGGVSDKRGGDQCGVSVMWDEAVDSYQMSQYQSNISWPA